MRSWRRSGDSRTPPCSLAASAARHYASPATAISTKRPSPPPSTLTRSPLFRPAPTLRGDGSSVNPKVKNLANLMKLKKRQGETFVLMLGAGASIGSGVVPTTKLMEDLLNEFGQDLDPSDRLE